MVSDLSKNPNSLLNKIRPAGRAKDGSKLYRGKLEVGVEHYRDEPWVGVNNLIRDHFEKTKVRSFNHRELIRPQWIEIFHNNEAKGTAIFDGIENLMLHSPRSEIRPGQISVEDQVDFFKINAISPDSIKLIARTISSIGFDDYHVILAKKPIPETRCALYEHLERGWYCQVM